MQTQYENIKENAKYIFLQKMITPAVNMLIAIYVVRTLSIKDYGIYNLLYAMIGYITLFSSMGLLNAFQRYIPEYFTQKYYSRVKRLFNYGFFIRLCLALLIFFILSIVGNSINILFKTKNFSEYIQFFFIGIVIFLEIQIVEVTLSSLLLNKYIMISYLATTIIKAGLIFLFLEQNCGLKGLLLAETIYFGMLLMMQLFFYYTRFAKKYRSSENTLPVKKIIRYSGFSYLDELGWTILDVKTDFFIISSFLGPAMVGIYAFANQFIEMISKIMPFKIMRPLIRTLFFALFSKNKDVSQLNKHYNFLNKIIAFISLPIFLGVMVIGDKIIIYVFDPKYLPALKILWIFAGFMMIVSFQFPLQLVVQAFEKVEITFYAKIFSIYNLIGDLLIVQIYGIMGIALITCSARLFQIIFIYFKIRKSVNLQIEVQSIFKILVNAMLMTTGLFLARDLIDNVFSLICFSFAGLVFYLVVSFLNKSFFNEEREFINKILPRPVFVF